MLSYFYTVLICRSTSHLINLYSVLIFSSVLILLIKSLEAELEDIKISGNKRNGGSMSWWDSEEEQRDKARKKAEAIQKQKKAEKKERWAKEAQAYQDTIDNRYGSGSRCDQRQDYTNFNKFCDSNNKTTKQYQNEVTERFSKMYYASMDKKEAPTIDRGLGVGSNQKIKMEQNKFSNKPTIGPMGASTKQHIDYNQFQKTNTKTHNPSLSDQSLGFSKDIQFTTGKLTRPF